MTAFDQIIVPLDLVTPSEAVLAVASVLARRAHVGVRLVTVASPGLDHSDDEAELRDRAAALDVPGTTSGVILSNDEVSALQQVGKNGLLAIETRARRPLAAALLGSTTNSLLRSSARPVLLVGPAVETPAAMDVMQVCIDAEDAAAALVPVACAWARALDLKLRFVHAETDEAMSDAAVVESAAKRAADEFGVEATVGVVTGRSVSAALLDDAEQCGAGIIAVGMRPRSRVAQLALGSEAMTLTHGARVPVLAVPLAFD
jgi:nucleotide-binding universal stress UspA family protein